MNWVAMLGGTASIGIYAYGVASTLVSFRRIRRLERAQDAARSASAGRTEESQQKDHEQVKMLERKMNRTMFVTASLATYSLILTAAVVQFGPLAALLIVLLTVIAGLIFS